MSTTNFNTGLLKCSYVTRRVFDQGTKDLDGKDISGQTFFEVTVEPEKNYGGRNVISLVNAKKVAFKSDPKTAPLYACLVDMFRGNDNKITLKVGEITPITEELLLEGQIKTCRLPQPMQRVNNGKIDIIHAIKLAVCEGENETNMVERIIKAFKYVPVNSGIQNGSGTENEDTDNDEHF